MKKCALKIQARSKIVVKHALHWLSVQGKLYLRAMPQFVIVAVLLFPVAYFTEKYIEACFQIIALFALRYKFPKTYHSETTMRCTFLTLSIGYLAIPRVLPTNVALFGAVFVSFVIAFLSWLAQEFIDRKERITELEAAPVPEPLSFMTCSREEFDILCINNGIKPNRIEYVWDLLRGKISTSEMMDKYCVAEKTISQDRWRYKKKFSNPIDSEELK